MALFRLTITIEGESHAFYVSDVLPIDELRQVSSTRRPNDVYFSRIAYVYFAECSLCHQCDSILLDLHHT
jgi:hypothetical protein